MAKDLGAAIRSLRRAPAFTALVVLALALGIGATTAMFSVVDAVLLNPLPIANADRLTELWTTTQPSGNRQPGASSAVIRPLRDEAGLFAAVEAYQFGTAVITGGGEPDNITAPGISRGLLDLMGASPALGRLFQEADVSPESRVVLISERLWLSRFGGDPQILEREIVLDDQPHKVIGVLPARFRFPESTTDVWRPLDLGPTAKSQRVQVVAVTKPGVMLSQVDARLASLAPALRASGALRDNQSLSSDVLLQMRFGAQVVGSAFYVLFGAVGLVLLVACVNVTNLLLVRGSVRHGELALMSALGADRRALVSSVLTESALLAMLGGVAGLAVAKVLLVGILSMVPPQLTYLSNAVAALDWRALMFAATLSTLTCLVFGMLPAWRTAKIDATDALKQGSMNTIGSRDDRWQALLVAGQLALVLILLAGAGLLLRSFARLLDVAPGFNSSELAVVSVQLPPHRYNTPGASLMFMRELERRVEDRSDLKAAFASGVPPSGGGLFIEVEPETEGGLPDKVHVAILPFASVSSDYFETMGIPILAGRTFDSSDSETSIIVNDLMARRFWGEVSPVGRRFRASNRQPWSTVVGVARDVRQMGATDAAADGMEFYQPFSKERRAGFCSFVVRTTGDKSAAMQTIKERIWELDDRLPIADASTMDARLGESLTRQRFFLSLTSMFALTAVLLAAIGVYGVSVYWVSRRRRELAIRVALGATRENLMAMVIGRGLRLATIGAVAGLAIAMAGARVLESLLFATSARDPLTLIGVTLLLVVLAVLACTLPAISASKVDPMSALRAE